MAMTVPNRGDIFHMLIATKGYFNAKTLGHKLATCLKNLEQTTAKGWHYDFGLRGAIAICKTAGTVRRADPSLDESLALSIALFKTVGGKFPAKEREALASYITTTFVGPNQQSKA